MSDPDRAVLGPAWGALRQFLASLLHNAWQVCHPPAATIDEAKEMLRTVQQGIAPYIEPFALPEPNSDDIALVRKLMDKAAE